MIDESKPQFGPYKAKKLLGSGATSRVWLASRNGQDVAVKCIKDKKYLPNLEAELRILESIQHNAFQKLLDADRDALWFAMEHIEGPSIGTWCKTEGLDGIRTVFLDLCEALAVLHDSGSIHGDIKTSNIRMEPNGRTKLIDFGSTTSTHRSKTVFKGTLGYVAPEVLRGEPATPLSDIYGLGVVLYEALTGRAPFQTRDPAALAYIPMISIPIPPSSFETDIPQSWDALIPEMLCRSPKQRPQSQI